MTIKRWVVAFLSILTMFCFSACGVQNAGNTENKNDSTEEIDVVIDGSDSDDATTESTDNSDSETDSAIPDGTESANEEMIDIQIESRVLTATLADNSSAREFADLLAKGEITVSMRDYGNFEKVGNLPQSIVRNDERITTEAGDIILYQGNQITIYYDTNTWNFTRLGKIKGVSGSELKALLGEGNISVTFRLHKN